ncbi:MAG: helix-turn-helix transcriptional regulator [Oscillospiraceae bacterium]|nr:helix-turn-helix transcriptional regulator [Oscillospiraceae bacterium]
MFENRVRELREELGMTQDELSKRAQISRATISFIEKNKKTDLKVSTMLAISNALGAKIGDIFLIK